MKRFAALLLVFIVAACAKPEPQQVQRRRGPTLKPISTKGPDDSVEQTSIISLAHGATVAQRTGEMLLEHSAVRAIDGDPQSYWMAPPNDFPQSMIVALPARTRIETIGLRSDQAFTAHQVTFERSIDGTAFQPMLTATAKATMDPQWFDVAPGEATHIRVTMVDPTDPGRPVVLRSILFRGGEVEPPHGGDIGGCWGVNDVTMRFERKGASARGVAAMGDQPMQLDGGFDGRTYRFNWIRGNDYGYAMIAVTPDGKRFSGIEWHEEAIPLFYGDSWFGQKKSCAPLPVPADTRERYLKRASRYSLFGLRFHDDGSLDGDQSAETLQWLAKFASEHPVQLIGREFRRASANENRAFAKVELDSVLAELQRMGVKEGAVTFVVKGSDDARQKPESDAARAMYSTVDVEIRR